MLADPCRVPGRCHSAVARPPGEQHILSRMSSLAPSTSFVALDPAPPAPTSGPTAPANPGHRDSPADQGICGFAPGPAPPNSSWQGDIRTGWKNAAFPCEAGDSPGAASGLAGPGAALNKSGRWPTLASCGHALALTDTRDGYTAHLAALLACLVGPANRTVRGQPMACYIDQPPRAPSCALPPARHDLRDQEVRGFGPGRAPSEKKLAAQSHQGLASKQLVSLCEGRGSPALQIWRVEKRCGFGPGPASPTPRSTDPRQQAGQG